MILSLVLVLLISMIPVTMITLVLVVIVLHSLRAIVRQLDFAVGDRRLIDADGIRDERAHRVFREECEPLLLCLRPNHLRARFTDARLGGSLLPVMPISAAARQHRADDGDDSRTLQILRRKDAFCRFYDFVFHDEILLLH